LLETTVMLMRGSQLGLLVAFVVVACGTPDETSGLNGRGAADAPLPGAADGGASPSDSDGGTKPAPLPVVCNPGRAGAIGDRELKIKSGGDDRLALVHVPKSYDPGKGTQLVMAFHGYGGSAEQMKEQTGFDAESDKRGFIVAYVQGTGMASKGFNAGDCCGKPAWTSNTDDLGLARDIIKKLTIEYCIDTKRIFNAGFSNGGFMSYRFVCEAADVFAAVASVSGVLGLPPDECKPARPVPIFHVHGTADKTVPYEGGGAAGGLGSLVNIKFRSVKETIATFQSKFTCEVQAKETFKGGDTRCEEWSNCQGGARLDLCTVTEGGHQWPGGKPTPVGGKTSDFMTTRAVLDFFEAHPMP